MLAFQAEGVPADSLGVPFAPSLPQVCIFDEIVGSRGGLLAALGPYVGPFFASLCVLSWCMFDSSVFVGSWLLLGSPKSLKLMSADLGWCAENIYSK